MATSFWKTSWAVAAVAAVTAGLLDALPPRRRPPGTTPPLRRLADRPVG